MVVTFLRIEADLKETVIGTALYFGSDAEWDFAYQQYRNSNVASEQVAFLSALSCTREPWLLARFVINSVVSIQFSYEAICLECSNGLLIQPQVSGNKMLHWCSGASPQMKSGETLRLVLCASDGRSYRKCKFIKPKLKPYQKPSTFSSRFVTFNSLADVVGWVTESFNTEWERTEV